jgi:hypothetical protein
MLHYQFMAMAQFAELADISTGELHDRASAACRVNDIPSAAATLAHEHRNVGGPVLLALGVDSQTSEEIFRRFSQYLDYLVSAWRIGYSASDDETVTILSERYAHPAGLAARRSGSRHSRWAVHYPPAANLASAAVNSWFP